MNIFNPNPQEIKIEAAQVKALAEDTMRTRSAPRNPLTKGQFDANFEAVMSFMHKLNHTEEATA